MTGLNRRQFIGATAGLALTLGGPPSLARAVTINPRSSWAIDRPPAGPLDVEDVRFLIVHHSASGTGHTGDDAPRIIRSYYDYHTSDEKGWNDIAYNFLIDADGGIWEGRAGSIDGPVAGDATGGNQGFSQLVCIIGDYNTAQPSQTSLRSLVALLAWLAGRYEISTAPGATTFFASKGSNRHPAGTEVTTPTIIGHRAMSQTTCPGDNLNAYVVDGLMADVEAVRAGSTTTTTVPATTTTTRPDSTTTAPTTTVPSTTTLPPTTSSMPGVETSLAAANPAEGSLALPSRVAATAGGFVVAGAGLLLWRRRRMRGGPPR